MATTDTEVDLVINEISQQQLDELDAAGTVPPNQIFFTDGDNDAILSLPIGSIFASAIPQTDAAFHLLDGSEISQSGMYKDFSNLVKSLVAAGYAISCTLTQYNTDIANTGNCGKFVIDDTAGTIKLPTITKFVEGLSNLTDIGKSLQAGLPNITGTFRLQGDSTNAGIDAPATGSGSVTPVNGNGSGADVDGTGWNCGLGFDFNASKSSAVYGRSSEVQPNATRYPYYIVLANSYKSKVALDVDNILQEVDGKAGLVEDNVFTGTNKFNNTVNFSEVPTVNGASINNLSIVPSSNYVSISQFNGKTAVGTYEYPAAQYNGYVTVSFGLLGGSYVTLKNTTANITAEHINYSNNNWAEWTSLYVPCAKGDTIKLTIGGENLESIYDNYLRIAKEI